MATTRPNPKSQQNHGHEKPTWPVGYTPRIVVKFKDEAAQKFQIPYDERVERSPDQYLGPNWSQLAAHFPGITLQRLITSLTPDRIRGLVERGQRRRPDYTFPNFSTYFAFQCPSNVDPYSVLEAVKSWQIVELAYVESPPLPPPNLTLNPLENPSMSGQQTYLCAAPRGIDAQYAWTFTGGDGGGSSVGLQFIDMEQGWILDHQDLPSGIQIICGYNRLFFGHGTGTLGIVLAVPNNVETAGTTSINTKVGVTPNVSTNMVTSMWPDATSQYVNRVNAILAAVAAAKPGDVILLEDHVWAYGSYSGIPSGTGWYRVPIEVEDANWNAIKMATANDIIVIEAAGNGGIDLDLFTPAGTYYSAQENSNVTTSNWGKDSGAIMVAAADSSTHSRGLDSNYGSKVTCWAWDNNVWTTGYDDDYPPPADVSTSDFAFSGTSGAAAIVAGASMAIQGIAQAHKKGDLSNYRFSPDALRQFLIDPSHIYNGTPSKPGPSSPGGAADKIGLMPNLRGIINQGLGLKHPVWDISEIVGSLPNEPMAPP